MIVLGIGQHGTSDGVLGGTGVVTVCVMDKLLHGCVVVGEFGRNSFGLVAFKALCR